MAYFSGRDGSMWFAVENQGGGFTYRKAAKATNWQLTSSQASLDTTTLEDTDRTVIYGVRSMTGSCRILYYQSTRGTNDLNNGASELIGKLIKERNPVTVDGVTTPPEPVVLRFNVDDGSPVSPQNVTGGKHIDVVAVITSASMAMAVGEILAADISFDVVGAPIEVTL